MSTFRSAMLAACVAAATFAPAGAATTHPFHYVHANDVDLTVLLPPPNPDSAEEQVDDRKVASVVANRTPAQLADALDESRRSVFFFAPSVGAGFAPEHLPLTSAIVLSQMIPEKRDRIFLQARLSPRIESFSACAIQPTSRRVGRPERSPSRQ